MKVWDETPVPWKSLALPVGAPDEKEVEAVWFEAWFLEEGICEAPACTWLREGDYVKKIPRKGWRSRSGKPGILKVWKLTGEWRLFEYRWQMKAVWPD